MTRAPLRSATAGVDNSVALSQRRHGHARTSEAEAGHNAALRSCAPPRGLGIGEQTAGGLNLNGSGLDGRLHQDHIRVAMS